MDTQITSQQVQQLVIASQPNSKLSMPQFEKLSELINRYIEQGKRPLFLYCIVSGSKCAMTAKQLFDDRLAQFDGDIIKLMTEYVGRGGGRTLRKLARNDADGEQRMAKKQQKADRKLAKKQQRKLTTTKQPAVAAPEIDPYENYKSPMPNGTLDWFWRHPSYVFRKEPRKFTLQEQIDLVANTCHRVDLIADNCCNQCQYVLICGCKCKTVRDGRGNKVKLTDKGLFTKQVFDDLVEQYPDVNRIGVDFFLSQQLPS